MADQPVFEPKKFVEKNSVKVAKKSVKIASPVSIISQEVEVEEPKLVITKKKVVITKSKPVMVSAADYDSDSEIEDKTGKYLDNFDKYMKILSYAAGGALLVYTLFYQPKKISDIPSLEVLPEEVARQDPILAQPPVQVPVQGVSYQRVRVLDSYDPFA